MKIDAILESQQSHMRLIFSAQNAQNLPKATKPNTYFETNGYISIHADKYSEKHDAEAFSFSHLDGYGRTASAMKVLPTFHAPFTKESKDVPYLEYTFFAESDGDYTAEFFFSPTNPPLIDNVMEYAYSVNGGETVVKNVVNKDTFVTYFSDEWIQGAEENIQKRRTTVSLKKGENTLRFYAYCPTLVLEKLVLFKEGKEPPSSFLGASESYRQ